MIGHWDWDFLKYGNGIRGYKMSLEKDLITAILSIDNLLWREDNPVKFREDVRFIIKAAIDEIEKAEILETFKKKKGKQ